MVESNREKDLFEAALDIPALEERAAYLEQACGGDRELLARVQALLEVSATATDFLADVPREAVLAATGEAPLAEGPGTVIGRYKLLQQIGEGGMGVVWMAEQTEPVRRRVALKIIKLGMDTKQVVARFEAERQALALMDHPNIARVLDAGATETGRPYFVMELVRGISITRYCDANQLDTPQRLALFTEVCSAVQHAHNKGIIHRDLKPSNILVTSNDGVPLPKVIDFGIAKATTDIRLTDQTLFTRFEMFIGTPAYMSPEQAGFNASDVDTGTDIYSLGVLLYELLTGKTPFDGKELMSQGIDVLRRTIREQEPPSPSTRLTRELAATVVGRRQSTRDLAVPTQQEIRADDRRRRRLREQIALLRGDLDWIVLKAIEKVRTRRYETANGLAMDVRRYLANEPVVARPQSMAYRIQKAWQRNRFVFTAATLVGLTFIVGVVSVIYVQSRANKDYQRRLYVSDLNRAGLFWEAGQEAESRVLLGRSPADLRNWEWNFLQQQLDRWVQEIVFATTHPVRAEVSIDGQVLAISGGGLVRILEYPGGQPRCEIPFTEPYWSPASLSPGGEYLATLQIETGGASVWSTDSGDRILELTHGGPARALTWATSGEFLVTGGNDAIVRLWDLKTGREEHRIPVAAPVYGLAVSPDDRTLAVGKSDTSIELVEIESGAIQQTLRSQGPFNSWLRFSPDGRKLVVGNSTAGGYRSDKRVWSLDGGGSLDLRSGAEANDYSFSDDSRRLAIVDETGTVQVWDLEQRTVVDRFSAHTGAGTSVHWLADGEILSSGTDGKVKHWHSRREMVSQLHGHEGGLRMLAFSPDNRWIASSGLEARVLVWDLREGLLARSYGGHLEPAGCVAFSREGRVASADDHGMVRLWDPATLATHWETSLAPAADPYWLAFSPDGRRLYAPSRTDTLTVLDAATGRRLQSVRGLGDVLDGIAVSPDGRWIALCRKTGLIVLEAEDLRESWSTSGLPDRCAAFSPDGKWIATGDTGGEVSLYEVASAGRARRKLLGHSATVKAVSFHPDGSRLVSCSADGQLKMWDWRTGEVLLTLSVPGGGILWHVVFSPDGRTIAAAGGDGVISLWGVE